VTEKEIKNNFDQNTTMGQKYDFSSSKNDDFDKISLNFCYRFFSIHVFLLLLTISNRDKS
jgi:hypothetical protein